MPEIEYPCPTCGTVLKAAAVCAGAADRCPECESLVKVPGRLPVVQPARHPTLMLTVAEAKAAAGGLDLLRRSHWVSAAGWCVGLAAALGAVIGPSRGGPFAADAPLTKVFLTAMIALLTAGAVIRTGGYIRVGSAARRVKAADLLVYAAGGAVLTATAGIVYVIPWLIGPGYRNGPQPLILAIVAGSLLLGRPSEFAGLSAFRGLLIGFDLPKTLHLLNEVRYGSLIPILVAVNLLLGMAVDSRPVATPNDNTGLLMPAIVLSATYIGVAAWQYGRVFARLRQAALESADLVRRPAVTK